MQESDITAILSEGQEALEELKKFSETEIPNSLAEAVEKGVDIAIQTAEAAILISYLPEQRHEDRKRVIRLDDALTLLQQLEDQYLKDEVEGTLRALWGYFFFWPELIKDAWLGIWAGIEALKFELVQQAIFALWRRVLRDWFSFYSIVEIQKPLRDVLALRQRFDDKARKKALPQRNAKRVWRRKRTRS